LSATAKRTVDPLRLRVFRIALSRSASPAPNHLPSGEARLKCEFDLLRPFPDISLQYWTAYLWE
jgi:hypothetical protein